MTVGVGGDANKAPQGRAETQTYVGRHSGPDGERLRNSGQDARAKNIYVMWVIALAC